MSHFCFCLYSLQSHRVWLLLWLRQCYSGIMTSQTGPRSDTRTISGESRKIFGHSFVSTFTNRYPCCHVKCYVLHAMLHHPLALCTLSSCHCFQLGKMHQSQLALDQGLTTFLDILLLYSFIFIKCLSPNLKVLSMLHYLEKDKL